MNIALSLHIIAVVIWVVRLNLHKKSIVGRLEV